MEVFETAVQIADDARGTSLVLFHHEPTRSDDARDALVKEVRRHRREAVAAHEGM